MPIENIFQKLGWKSKRQFIVDMIFFALFISLILLHGISYNEGFKAGQKVGCQEIFGGKFNSTQTPQLIEIPFNLTNITK
jgi:hypothetical protein